MNLYGVFIGKAEVLKIAARSLEEAYYKLCNALGMEFRQGMKIEPLMFGWCEPDW